MSGSDLPPEVLAALRSAKGEVVSEPDRQVDAERADTELGESDDDYFDRHRRGGWLLR